MLTVAPLPVVLALALLTQPAKPAAAKKRRGPPPSPNVVLYHVNSKESFTLRPRDGQGGRPPKPLQKRFDRFLRCHHTNKPHAMSPRLIRLLYQTGRHWPGKRLEVVAGYRHPSVAKNPRSPHMQGVACDFRVAGVGNGELRDYLRKAFQKVGVGYYPNSSFVHLDVRKDRSAFWIDYSGPGERSMYSENAAGDLKSGRADTYHPSKIAEDWADDTEDARGNAPVGAVVPPAPPPGTAPPPAPAAAAPTPPAASDPTPP